MLLKRLSEAFGPSGCEGEVRNILMEELAPHVKEWRRDALGNLIAVKGSAGGLRVMLAAHMDECGLMISSIDRSGLLRFRKVGGIDDRVLVSKHVIVGSKKISGVIGAKAVHLQKPDERNQIIPLSGLYIDIGAKSKEDAEKLIKIGDYVVFATEYKALSDTVVVGKSFDDRAGCAVLVEVLKDEYALDIYGAFTVQEEIGLRGAGVAAYAIEPDLAIVLEGTTCSDIPPSKEYGYCTTLGQGPAITIMDASVICDRRMIAELVRIAKDHDIPLQFKRSVTGGSDAGKINQTKAGVPVVVISVPCRYIHSPISMLNLTDFHNTIKLVKLFLKSIAEGGFVL
ncbi:MAG: putative aminopeptidase YsdC [Firmicutes bacterium]|nr:putative aminopeptidase YsdC [Bacillota bacterium]